MTENCQVENIPIPEDISLLGVDNDELLCQISDPQISSIALNVEKGGYRLGKMMDKQFSSKDPYVDTLIKYIDDNFDQCITTDQILAQIPLSRRSIEIRFKREINAMTIYKYLTNCRMQLFAQLLATTDLSLLEIADRCGSLDYPNISRTFKRFFGCAPKEYRQKKRKRICTSKPAAVPHCCANRRVIYENRSI